MIRRRIQGSILGPSLFNVYINDIFYFIHDIKIANSADDTSPYTRFNTRPFVIQYLY